MDATKGSASATPIYEDFVPTSELVSNENCDTLFIHLPGFKKEQLRVQLTEGSLRMSGSMPIGDNKMKRFQKEFPVSTNCETNKITARFENGSLRVIQPKLITPTTTYVAPEQHKLPPPQPAPTNELQATQNVAEKANGNKEGEGKKTCCSKNGKDMEKLTKNEEKTEAKTDGERKDNVINGKEDGGVNTRVENYRKMVRAMGERLKMQRRVVNVVLAALFTCIVAIYVNNLITSKN